jgi:hypothetical protein
VKRLVTALLVLAACDDTKTTPEARTSLHVALPEGWRASATKTGLLVGPEGRVVLELESTLKPLPDSATFLRALEREGVEVLKKESVDTFVGARYLISGPTTKRDAFLGVRQTGPTRTIWCSTTSSAKPDEVEAAMTVCRSLSWEG